MVRERLSMVLGLAMLAGVLAAGRSASAQPPSAPPPSHAPREVVRNGVARLHTFARRSRSTQGWSEIIGGSLSAGLGGWLVVDGLESSDRSALIAGSALGILGASTILGGTLEITTVSAVEKTTALLLSDDSTLTTTGYILLAHEAERARTHRIRSGILNLASGVSSGLLLLPVLSGEGSGSFAGLTQTWWLALIGTSAALNLIHGTAQLVGSSAPEEIFAAVRRRVLAPEVRVTPGLIYDGSTMKVGLVVGARF